MVKIPIHSDDYLAIEDDDNLIELYEVPKVNHA